MTSQPGVIPSKRLAAEPVGIPFPPLPSQAVRRITVGRCWHTTCWFCHIYFLTPPRVYRCYRHGISLGCHRRLPAAVRITGRATFCPPTSSTFVPLLLPPPPASTVPLVGLLPAARRCLYTCNWPLPPGGAAPLSHSAAWCGTSLSYTPCNMNDNNTTPLPYRFLPPGEGGALPLTFVRWCCRYRISRCA